MAGPAIQMGSLLILLKNGVARRVNPFLEESEAVPFCETR